MVTILEIPPNTKCNQFSNNIPNQVVNHKAVSKVYNKRHMFPLFINSIYMCLLYYHHLKGVKRVGWAMSLLTLSLQ